MSSYDVAFQLVSLSHILSTNTFQRASTVNWGRIHTDSHEDFGFIYIYWVKVGMDILGRDAVRCSDLAAKGYPLTSSTSFSVALWGTKITKNVEVNRWLCKEMSFKNGLTVLQKYLLSIYPCTLTMHIISSLMMAQWKHLSMKLFLFICFSNVYGTSICTGHDMMSV